MPSFFWGQGLQLPWYHAEPRNLLSLRLPRRMMQLGFLRTDKHLIRPQRFLLFCLGFWKLTQIMDYHLESLRGCFKVREVSIADWGEEWDPCSPQREQALPSPLHSIHLTEPMVHVIIMMIVFSEWLVVIHHWAFQERLNKGAHCIIFMPFPQQTLLYSTFCHVLSMQPAFPWWGDCWWLRMWCMQLRWRPLWYSASWVDIDTFFPSGLAAISLLNESQMPKNIPMGWTQPPSSIAGFFYK